MKGPRLVNLLVTPHAAERFVERGGEVSVLRAEVALLKLMGEARRLRAIPREARREKGGAYFRAGDWILVVVDNRLVTTYPADGQWRWSA